MLGFLYMVQACYFFCNPGYSGLLSALRPTSYGGDWILLFLPIYGPSSPSLEDFYLSSNNQLQKNLFSLVVTSKLWGLLNTAWIIPISCGDNRPLPVKELFFRWSFSFPHFSSSKECLSNTQYCSPTPPPPPPPTTPPMTMVLKRDFFFLKFVTP